jgi:uncharacterized membrane protein YfcA
MRRRFRLPFPFDPLAALGVFALVALGAAVQASLGFGLGLIAAPLLFLIYPPLVPGPLLAASVLLSLLIAHRDREAIDLAGLGYALAGRIAGTLLAMLVASALSPERFELLFAALVVLGVALSVCGFQLAPSPAPATAAGALSGFMGTLSAIGGPPMALLYQRASGDRLRGTLSGFFAVGATLSLAALALVGRYGLTEIALSIALMPAILLGYLSARWTRGRVDRAGTRRFVLGLSFMSALGVLVRALL